MISYSWYEMIWIVLIYSCLGWCAEVAFAAVKTGRFVNRGFLNGPVCPIYGFGMLIVLLVLEPVKENLALLFFGSMVFTSLLEFLVGFALETNDEEANARKKLEKKNLDFIVLNSLQNKGTCFQSDDNQICIIGKDNMQGYPRKSKQEVAADIIDELFKQLNRKA